MAGTDDRARRTDPRRRRRTLRRGADQREKSVGGYLVSGTKHYATNASMAEWLWIGRVASDSHPKPIMFMLHKDTPGLKIDTEAWRPTGMRACVSPWLYLENCFVPEENLLGQPGQFLGENWMGKINFAFTANYLGSARAMYDWALAYIRERNGARDSYRQLRFGELKSMLDAARLILYNAVRMFKNSPNEAMIAAHEAKWMAKETLEKVIWSTRGNLRLDGAIRQTSAGTFLPRHALAHDAWPPRHRRADRRRVGVRRRVRHQ